MFFFFEFSRKEDDIGMGGDAQFPSPLHRRFFSDLVFILEMLLFNRMRCSFQLIGFQTAPYVVVLIGGPYAEGDINMAVEP